MKRIITAGLLLLGLALPACTVRAQQPRNVQASSASATRNDITADLNFPSGRTLLLKSGGTLTLSGAVGGTPTGGTLNLSALTLTLPATVSGGGSSFQPLDSDLTSFATVTPSANGLSFVSAANYAAMRGLLDLEAGTDFLAYPTGTPTGSKYLRDDNSWQTITGGGDALVANPLSQFAATTSAQLAGVISNETGTGVVVLNSDPIVLSPNSAMGALAIDVTKKRNTKTATGDHTWTFSATPAAGTVFGVVLTGHSAATTQTIPSSFSLALQSAITTFTLPANAKFELTWVYDGSTYFLAGEPTTINDLSTITAATGDFVALHDASGGTDGKATIANVVATQIGSAVQAYDADLTSFATVTPSANGLSFVSAANYAAMRALLDLEAGTDFLGYPTGTPTGSKFLRDDNSWQTIGGGGDALVANPLSQFASTTSAQLRGVLSDESGTGDILTTNGTGTSLTGLPATWVIPLGDETTAITTGTKVTWRAPYACTVTAVRASLTTVSSSGLPTFDINEGGVSILSTKLTIDASEKTSTTAATAAVISDTALADDAELTIDIDTAGTGAAGAKVTIYVTRS